MHFAHPLPWWLAIALAAAVAGAVFAQYRRPLTPLTIAQRTVLVALRVLTLAAIVLFLFRPIVILPPESSRDAIVPILVDASRSMRIDDADGTSRIARAATLVKGELLPALRGRFSTEVFTVGDGVTRIDPAAADRITASARK